MNNFLPRVRITTTRTLRLGMALVLGVVVACSNETLDSPTTGSQGSQPTSVPETTNSPTPAGESGGEVESCSPETPRTMSTASVSVGFSYLPFYVAQEAGYFDEMGLDVEYSEAGGGGNMAGLVSGAFDTVAAAVTSAFNLRNEGQDIVAVGTYVDHPSTILVIDSAIAEESGLSETSSFEEKVRSLEGLSIGVSAPGSGATVTLEAILTEGGLDPEEDVDIVFLDTAPAILAAFAQRQIQAFMYTTPMATEARLEHSGTVLINPSKGEFPPTAGSYMVGTLAQGASLDDPDARATIGCFLAAVEKGLRLINSDPDAALDLARPVFGAIDEDLYRIGFEDTQGMYPETGCISEDMITRAVAFDQQFREVNNPPQDHYDDSLCLEYVRAYVDGRQ